MEHVRKKREAVFAYRTHDLLIMSQTRYEIFQFRDQKNLDPILFLQETKLSIAKQRGCHETLLWDRSKTDEELVKESIKDGSYDAIIDFVNNSITSNRAAKCLSHVSDR